MKFYFADMHLGHANALKFDNRPFKSLEEQDKVILDNINRTVARGNDLYFIGDAFWYSPDKVCKMLDEIECKNIFLVTGNHDRWIKNPECRKKLSGVYDLKRITDNGRIVILCHYPLAVWDQSHRGSYHVYGHVHRNLAEDGMTDTHEILNHPELKNAYNVGCMLPWMDYTPKTLDQIISGYQSYKEKGI
mgnify:CR=1 FL=1